MAVFVLPAAAEGRANFDFRVELDGAEYEFRMRFNSRDQQWYLSILDADGAPILMGQKVVVNADLTLRATVENAFGGRLYVLDSRDPEVAVTVDEIGDTIPMVYDDA